MCACAYFVFIYFCAEAASVAYDLMLQEDFGHPLSRVLSWYACHLRWRNPPPSDKEVAEGEQEQEEVQEENEVKCKFLLNLTACKNSSVD